MKKIHFDIIDSTNDYAKRNIESLSHFTRIDAGYQTKGKGRNQRVWESKKNQNILVSYVLKMDVDDKNMHQLSQVVAVSIIDFLQQYQINAKIKWPNDIYINNKKIAGVLIEVLHLSSQLKGIVIGMGLNVHSSGSLDTSICMCDLINEKFDLSILLDELTDFLEASYHTWCMGYYDALLMYANKHAYLRGKTCIVDKYGEITFLMLNKDGYIEVLKGKNKAYLLVNELSLHQR